MMPTAREALYVGADDFMAKTREVGRCLEWIGLYSSHGVPRWRVSMNKVAVAVRPLVFELTHGREPLPGHKIQPECRNERCVHPDCMVERKQSDMLRGTKRSIEFRLKIAETMRARSRINMDMVRHVRAERMTGAQAAAYLGKSESYANQVKRGEFWLDYVGVFPRAAGARA